MRREEAEQEAAWRNVNDERRTRLEFYAFDASAGLADDAWEVTMRLRREPPPQLDPEPDFAEVEPAPVPEAWDTEVDAELEAFELAVPARRRERRDTRRRGRRRAERPARRLRVERPARRRRRPVREPAPAPTLEDELDELVLEPPDTRLGRFARFVGATVIGVALLWMVAIAALAVMIRASSLTGFAIYGAALLVGVGAIGLGILIRRS